MFLFYYSISLYFFLVNTITIRKYLKKTYRTLNSWVLYWTALRKSYPTNEKNRHISVLFLLTSLNLALVIGSRRQRCLPALRGHSCHLRAGSISPNDFPRLRTTDATRPILLQTDRPPPIQKTELERSEALYIGLLKMSNTTYSHAHFEQAVGMASVCSRLGLNQAPGYNQGNEKKVLPRIRNTLRTFRFKFPTHAPL